MTNLKFILVLTLPLSLLVSACSSSPTSPKAVPPASVGSTPPVMAPPPSAPRMAAFPNEDLRIYEQSLGFLKKGFPQKSQGSWMGKPMRTLLVSSSAHYRHLPAVLVAAFSGNAKERENAFRWLDSYECENYLACSDFSTFLEAQLKAYGTSLSGAHRIKADQLLAKIKERNKTFPTAPQNGFCGESAATQESWLRLSYQLYCAPYVVAQNARGCGMLTSKTQPCSATEALSHSLDRWSGQSVKSGGRITSFEHSLNRGCDREWTVKVTCDGPQNPSAENASKMTPLEFTCTNPMQKYPAPITCKAKIL